MGLDDVTRGLDRVEGLLADGETGPVQDSLSWQFDAADADVQLGKACAMLGTCRQLEAGTNNYVSIVELSFNYDLDRPGRDLARAMHNLAESVHRYVVEFASAHSRCACDGDWTR